MQEACAHETKRLLVHFYVKAKTFVRLHIKNCGHFVPAIVAKFVATVSLYAYRILMQMTI